MLYLGDFAAGATVYTSFNTTDATGLPTSFDASAVAKVYKNGSTVESLAGVTLTADFDGRTGLHHVAIDLSADGTFYGTGADFFAVLTTGAVGGINLAGTIIAHFSIENRSTAGVPAAVLAAAASAPIAANVKQVNDVNLTGNGTVSTPWGPA